jgi:hypothetical protein
MKPLVELLLAFWWLAGIVLAPGWWKVLALFPPYAFYLVVERILQLTGVV